MKSSMNVIQENGENQETSVLDFLEIFVPFHKIIFFGTCTVFMMSIVLSFILPKIYSSTALILPSQQDQNLVGSMLAQMGGGSAISSDFMGTISQSDVYVSILKCEAIKDKIIDRFELKKKFGIKYRSTLYKKIDKFVNIKSGKKDGIVSISVEADDPKLASNIANAYVEELGMHLSKMSSMDAYNNKVYYIERLKTAKSELVETEKQLKQFQVENKTLDLTEQSKGAIKGLADLTAQLALSEVQLAVLQRQFTDSSQEIKNVKKNIDEIKSQINKAEGMTRFSALPSIGLVPEILQKYTRLMREHKIQEAVVDLLARQSIVNDIAGSKSVSSFQLIQNAKESDRKVKPKRALIVLFNTLCAFIFLIMASFVVSRVRQISSDRLHRYKI